MKKFISFALIAAMAVTTLVGCGNKGAKADGGSSDAAITVMSREDGSGTRGAFIELFGIEEEENGEVFIYRFKLSEDGEPDLENIEDDAEYEMAADAFDEALDKMEFDEIVEEDEEE